MKILSNTCQKENAIIIEGKITKSSGGMASGIFPWLCGVK